VQLRTAESRGSLSHTIHNRDLAKYKPKQSQLYCKFWWKPLVCGTRELEWLHETWNRTAKINILGKKSLWWGFSALGINMSYDHTRQLNWQICCPYNANTSSSQPVVPCTHTAVSKLRCQTLTKHTKNICELRRVISVKHSSVPLMMDRTQSETCWSDF